MPRDPPAGRPTSYGFWLRKPDFKGSNPGRTGGYTGTLSFRLTGNYTNGGFTSIHIPDATYDKTFTRSSANFSYSSHYNMTSWTWNSTIDPFGTTGSTRVVKFL